MRIVAEIIGAGVLFYLVATGVTSWLAYRAEATAAMKEKRASTKEKN